MASGAGAEAATAEEDTAALRHFGFRDETVQNLGGLPAISPSGQLGRAQGKRDDQGRVDPPPLFSPQVLDGLHE
jgi:hypothetical protein